MKKEYCFSSERLCYRTIKEQDSRLISLWRSDKNIIKYYRNSIPVSLESQKFWYNNKYLLDESRVDFIVYYNDYPIGFVALIDIDDKGAEVSYTIGNHDFQNKGFSKEMIESICCFGSEIFNINTFIAEVHHDNIISQKAAISAGFEYYIENGVFIKFKRVGSPNVKIYYCHN